METHFGLKGTTRTIEWLDEAFFLHVFNEYSVDIGHLLSFLIVGTLPNWSRFQKNTERLIFLSWTRKKVEQGKK